MVNTLATGRLLREYENLVKANLKEITGGPVSEDNLLLWNVLIKGPEDTPFEGGVYEAELKFPKDYPLSPPSMRFLCDLWHPNGMRALQICSIKRPFTISSQL